MEKLWQTPIQPLEKNVEKVLHYPSTDENNGVVAIGWRIPSATTDRFDLLALGLLLKYLNDTSASSLQKAFVEIDDPYASDIDYELDEKLESVLGLCFNNVPVAKTPLIKNQLMKTLREIVAQEDGIDVERMTIVINRSILEILNCWESSPHRQVITALLDYIAVGENTDDVRRVFSSIVCLF